MFKYFYVLQNIFKILAKCKQKLITEVKKNLLETEMNYLIILPMTMGMNI